MNINANMISLFGAVPPTIRGKYRGDATVADIMALALESNYALTPDYVNILSDMSSKERGMFFTALGAALNELTGPNFKTSPMYREFPNHDFVPDNMRVVAYILAMMGVNVSANPAFYGVNPYTGFQDTLFGINHDYDDLFTIPLKVRGGKRREIRFIKPATRKFVETKLKAIMENLTPLSSQEKDFVVWALDGNASLEVIQNIRFREKIPAIYGMISEEDYASLCNSVTDVLRLAAHLSGEQYVRTPIRWGGSRYVLKQPDLSLKSKPRFALSTAQGKSVMRILESVIENKNTDYETDFLRHEEFWKRLAEHIRVNSHKTRAPNAVVALIDLRLGWMKSWESKFAAASVAEKINMAKSRPGVFVRRLMELWNSANIREKDMIVDAAEGVFVKVDVMKLLQLYVHLSRTVHTSKRFHMLPNGKIMESRGKIGGAPQVLTVLVDHLHSRLYGRLPYSSGEDLDGMFVPAGNRSMSESDSRVSKGDRKDVKFESGDVLRLFLHWDDYCDVDMSAVFFSENGESIGWCTYYHLKTPYAVHSGDIQDGSGGAAEYIDINVDKARQHNVRYVLMNANVYSGGSFDTFPCYVGVMVRDGKTGKHFEPSTVEAKFSLDSNNRNNMPMLFDLETGQIIYMDLPGQWDNYDNVSKKLHDAVSGVEYFLNYDAYRVSYSDVLGFAGKAGAPPITADTINDKRDEILAVLAEA